MRQPANVIPINTAIPKTSSNALLPIVLNATAAKGKPKIRTLAAHARWPNNRSNIEAATTTTGDQASTGKESTVQFSIHAGF